MLHDVIGAEYKGDYIIVIWFDDGVRGAVDFSKYLDYGGVFRKFKDIEFFKKFEVNPDAGTLVWSDEVDVAPETLYEEALKSNIPAKAKPRSKSRS